MNEQFLLRKSIENQDKDAFEELYNKYADYALRLATAVTGNKVMASDAVQETFIRIYLNNSNFTLGRPFKPWFYRILINECNRLLKRDGKIIVMDPLENRLEVPEEDSHKFEEYEDLYLAIKDLDQLQKTPIVLKYLGGFKEAEIAQILDTNINTIKSRLYKGRKKLKEFLEKSNERGS